LRRVCRTEKTRERPLKIQAPWNKAPDGSAYHAAIEGFAENKPMKHGSTA
jgi:hypothetical protein